MNKYEHDIKIHILITIFNIVLVGGMITAIIVTNSLWYLLLMLLYKYRNKENDNE
jgi:hypothetical protein